MKTTTLLLASLFFAACGTTEPAPTPPLSSDGNEGVTLTTATPDRLTGTYVDATGLSLTFDTARSGDTFFLDLSTSAGHQLIHAETTPTSYVFTYLDQRLTLEIDKTWVAQVQAEGDDGPAAKDTSAMHWTGDMAVLDEMVSMPEVRALPWLSRALGSMGYTGTAYPASLAMHKMARESADALGIELPEMTVQNPEADYCARPTANDCYGMCGPGCTCWSWVCGDCCYHTGCAKHDSWCRSGQWYYCYNITAVIALFGC
ncbi:MAG: hypothetical protein ABI591_16535 [Kofleriaceae bacterium]